jgi:hypothetical protein
MKSAACVGPVQFDPARVGSSRPGRTPPIRIIIEPNVISGWTGLETQVETDTYFRRESRYPRVCFAAAAARRGTGGSLHPGLADGQPA